MVSLIVNVHYTEDHGTDADDKKEAKGGH